MNNICLNIDFDTKDEQLLKQVFKQNYKLYININKDINKDSITIDERKNVFKEQLKQYLNTYSKDMLNDFYLYWTEHNPGGNKMRFEKQDIFDIKRRLITWNKNNRKKQIIHPTHKPLEADTREVDRLRKMEDEFNMAMKLNNN